MSLELPFAGDWNARTGHVHKGESKALPVDPLSLWNADLRWAW